MQGREKEAASSWLPVGGRRPEGGTEGTIHHHTQPYILTFRGESCGRVVPWSLPPVKARIQAKKLETDRSAVVEFNCSTTKLAVILVSKTGYSTHSQDTVVG